MDARDGEVQIAGWREGSRVSASELVGELRDLGVRHLVYTDISRDGMQTGINADAYRTVAAEAGFPVVASGGVSTLADIEALVALGPGVVEGVITGRALYEGAFTLGEALDGSRRDAAAAGGRRAPRDRTRDPMLMKRVIPCLDVHEGRVVKGVNFVNIRDAGDPVEMAAVYDREGGDEVVFLDITASHEDRPMMLDVAARTAEECFIPYTVGGGMRSADDIRAMLSAGADKISLNSAAVRSPELITHTSGIYGSQCIVVAIDARRVPGGRDRWEVFVNGGRINTETGRRGVGRRGRTARRGGDPAHEHGLRRDEGRLRHPAHPLGHPRGQHPRDRERRRRASSTTSPRSSSRPTPTPCSPRACSTSASTRCGRSRSTWPPSRDPRPPVAAGARRRCRDSTSRHEGRLHFMPRTADTSAWDARYRTRGALWGYFPAVSAEETWWRLRETGARRVLVVGCGYGRHVAYFARRGFDTTGLDASRAAIDMAHETAKEDGLDLVLTCASATKMPFPTASFDAVYDHALLHHLSAEDRALAVERVRPGAEAGRAARHQRAVDRGGRASGVWTSCMRTERAGRRRS